MGVWIVAAFGVIAVAFWWWKIREDAIPYTIYVALIVGLYALLMR